jgi:hypothetical protein
MSQEQLYVSMARNSWDAHIKRTNAVLDGLTDAQLQEEIAPGRNRGIYLLGHLTAVHDAMFDILGLGQRQHPELDAVFLSSPDKAGLDMPSAAALRQSWSEVNARLGERLSKMLPSEWFTQHTQMSAEDFAKEPHRNKLSVLLSRTTHMAYHLGQLVLLKK